MKSAVPEGRFWTALMRVWGSSKKQLVLQSSLHSYETPEREGQHGLHPTKDLPGPWDRLRRLWI